MTCKKNQKQTMSLQVTEGLTVTILPDSNHEFLMPTKQVALGFGVHPDTIRSQKRNHEDELVNGKHFISNVQILHSASLGSSRGAMWTKRGIVRLGFFIKSQNAKLFRDWAEDLVIKQGEQSSLPQQNYLKISENTDTELNELVQSAVVACGSAAKLAKRLSISGSVFSHLLKRPWLVSAEMIKAIKIGCKNIISSGATVDTATLDALMNVEDKDARVYLYNQLKKGGLL